jgi:predicted MFS family arabinose efflux permease
MDPMRLIRAYRGLLDNSALVRLLLGEFVSSIGDWLYLVALLVVVYERESSALLLGVVGAARVLPYVVLSVPAGIVADRFDRRAVLIVTDVARGAVMILLAILVAIRGPLETIVGLTLVAASFSAFFGPAIGAYLPSLVRDERQLGPANSAWATLDNLAFVIGPAIGGLLIAAGGLTLAFLINAVSFAIVALVLWRLPTAHRATRQQPLDPLLQTTPASADPATSAELGPAPALRRVRDLARPIGGLALINVVAGLVFGGLGVLTVVIAVDRIGGGEAATGYLNAAIGVGGLVGAVASGAIVLQPRLAGAVLGGAVILGAGLFALGQARDLVVALIAMAVASTGSLVVEVTATTLFQRVVPDEVRGRALGLMETIGVAAYALGALLLPLAAIAIGVEPVLAGAAIAIAVGAFAGVVVIGRAAWSPEAFAGLAAGRARLAALPVFAGLPSSRLDAAAGRLERVTTRAGEVVIAQGDNADRFYVVDSGRFLVTQEAEGLPPAELRELREGDVFGEIGLLTGAPRSATVTATADGVLLALGGRDFLELVGSGPGLTSRLLDLHRGATASPSG